MAPHCGKAFVAPALLGVAKRVYSKLFAGPTTLLGRGNRRFSTGTSLSREQARSCVGCFSLQASVRGLEWNCGGSLVLMETGQCKPGQAKKSRSTYSFTAVSYALSLSSSFTGSLIKLFLVAAFVPFIILFSHTPFAQSLQPVRKPSVATELAIFLVLVLLSSA